MNSGEFVNAENLKTDIVIVGGGGSGLAAAVAAAEKGAKVIIVEKRRSPGGNATKAAGLFAAESPVQKRMKIDARKEELFKVAMDYSHWRINPRLIRAFIDKSGETIQWLEDNGIKIDDIATNYPNQIFRTWHIPNGGGNELVQGLVKKCAELGVRVLYQTPAKKILLNGKGSVIGILAETNQKEIRIIAGSIIIAAGGYAGNKNLLKKYYPSYNEEMYLFGLPLTGDGLLMTSEVGADTEGLGCFMETGPYFPAPRHIHVVVKQYNTIWVNKRGERFANENIDLFPELANALARQPDKISYTLFDEKIKQNFIVNGIVRGMGVNFPPLTKLASLENDLQLEAAKGKIKIADSWSDIAGWIGASSEVLQTTIDEYNSFCDRGYDAIFNKDRRYLQPLQTPPFYAMKCYPCLQTTIGGIKINHRMEVLDKQNNPIPGLYATGDNAGGWQSDTYSLIISGAALGFAINSGRIAGENATKYISEIGE